MLALLSDDAVSNDADLVGVLDGGESVGNHDAGATLTSPVQGFLHNLHNR